ncbi:nucleoside 2-deoxyribosyltransferase domain-containing protein [Kitasatospora sp. NPDC092286]|uniref:nucleoside 2-deoxyribosyltransferase domain-containing protein n=1 Tax=Kitasatospora sp. NPDC092286 TaxID=3364087 RepID=UPI0037FE85E9
MSLSTLPCPFCDIIAGRAPAQIVRQWPDTIAILPRHPVTPNHFLVIPHKHVVDAGCDPDVAGRTAAAAAELAAELSAANIITSIGTAATQSVGHTHFHVVERKVGDGVLLPWSHQHAARAAARAGADRSGVNVVMAREPLPGGPSVFLAGPTPGADHPVDSWRPEAIAELQARWTGRVPLSVLNPESRGGIRAEHYRDQVRWETEARRIASAVLYWIPRDLLTMPAFTTNIELGADAHTGRAVLGCPPDCPDADRNRYPAFLAEYWGAPVRETLTSTVAAAIDLVNARSPKCTWEYPRT